MCGICGYVGWHEIGESIVRQINELQKHRGPDGTGLYKSECGRVVFGMTRLAIVDIAHGSQPMSIDDGAFTIIFNGEIFNTRELRATLIEDFNEKFQSTNSDTELVVRLFKHFGPACFSYLNGMFATAIFCRAKDTVTIARDCSGIKPLLYSLGSNHLIFGSEMRSFANIDLVDKTINYHAVSEYLDFGFINAPRTIFSGIDRLEPGYFIEINTKTMSHKLAPWRDTTSSGFSSKNINAHDARNLIKSELVDAMSRWCISDVPISFSLSGGLDSSLLAAIGSTDKQIATYSVGFASDKFKRWDETDVSREISLELNTQHREILIDLVNFENDLLDIMDILAEPYSGGIPSYFLFQEAQKDGFKVMVTGVGGDELFGNYSRASNLRKTVSALSEFRLRDYIDLVYLYQTRRAMALNLKSPELSNFQYEFSESVQDGVSRANSLEEVVYVVDNMTQLPNDFLSMLDLLSMNFSVEARTPFLDKDFVALVNSVPMVLRNTPADYKSLMVETFRDLLPRAALGKAKSGFSLPLSWIMRDTLKGHFDILMSKKSLQIAGIYNNKVYENFIEPFLSGDNRFVALVWRIFYLQMWLSKTKS